MSGQFVQLNKLSQKASSSPVGYKKMGSGCWEWVGARTPGGYGLYQPSGGKLMGAHRWMYEQHRGPIPDGHEIHHLCRKKGCVNPDHLETMTHRRHMEIDGRLADMRRVIEAGNAAHRNKTHCSHGHPYSGKNLYVSPRGYRGCRTCKAEWMRRKRESRRTKTAV